MMSRTKIAIAVLVIAPITHAHELPENRATVVLRDKTHVTVTLFINYAEALHAALSPQRPFAAFLMTCSSMKPEDLSKELVRAQTKFQSSTRLYLAGPHGSAGTEVKLTNWLWPDAKQVQAMLQRQIMQAMVDPAAHAHEAPLEIHADGNAPREIVSLLMQFPTEFQRVLTVSYRPNQVWTERGMISPEIRF